MKTVIVIILASFLTGCASSKYSTCETPLLRYERKAFSVANRLHSDCVAKKAYKMRGVFTPPNMVKD